MVSMRFLVLLWLYSLLGSECVWRDSLMPEAGSVWTFLRIINVAIIPIIPFFFWYLGISPPCAVRYIYGKPVNTYSRAVDMPICFVNIYGFHIHACMPYRKRQIQCTFSDGLVTSVFRECVAYVCERFVHLCERFVLIMYLYAHLNINGMYNVMYQRYANVLYQLNSFFGDGEVEDGNTFHVMHNLDGSGYGNFFVRVWSMPYYLFGCCLGLVLSQMLFSSFTVVQALCAPRATQKHQPISRAFGRNNRGAKSCTRHASCTCGMAKPVSYYREFLDASTLLVLLIIGCVEVISVSLYGVIDGYGS